MFTNLVLGGIARDYRTAKQGLDQQAELCDPGEAENGDAEAEGGAAAIADIQLFNQLVMIFIPSTLDLSF